MEYDEALIDQYDKMVCGIAWQFTNNPDHFKDLRQVGYEGLRHAAATFDPDRGATFTTYAYGSVRRAMARYVNYGMDVVRMPEYLGYKASIGDLDEAYDVAAPSPDGHRLREALEAMDTLDPRIAMLLRMHYLEGHSKKHLARMLGVNYQTLSYHMRRALEKLRAILEDD